MKKPLNFKDAIRQLKKDLIGKDSYRGVTLTYSWMANQFGHFSLGFIPTLILFSFLKRTSIYTPEIWSAVIISALWLIFECYNFLGPLLLNRQSKSKVCGVPEPKQQYIFQPAWANVAFDTFTDLCFFWLGAFSTSLFLQFSIGEPSTTVILILVIQIVILIYPVAYWFVTKMYIQYARLPIQFRLSQWNGNGNLDESDQETVLRYLTAASTSLGYHLLIFGGRRSGKSPLAIGLATELSMKRRSCSYYPGIKLYNLFSLTDQAIRNSECSEKWSWRKASLLVVDDLNPGSPIVNNLISPTELIRLIDTPISGNSDDNNRKDLKSKNVIWVMGDDGINIGDDWKRVILEIGVPINKIMSINLSYNYM